MPDSPATGAAEIGWARAAISAAAILVVGFVGAVSLPSLVVTRLVGLSTTARGLLAAAVCITVVIAMAIGLRRLQARQLI